MDYRKKILTGRFRSLETERLYQSYATDRTISYDRAIFFLGAIIYTAYAVLDYYALTHSTIAIIIRLIIAAGAFSFVYAIKFKIVARYYENILAILMAIVGNAINIVIAIENDPSFSYYVGLLHVTIYLGALLRIGVRNAFLICLSMFIGFILASRPYLGEPSHVTALFFMFMVFWTSIIGAYLMERMRRSDFEKVTKLEEIIQERNEMLKTEALMTARKDAFFRLLTHYVKTPLHMVIGYNQFLINETYGAPAQGEYKAHAEEIDQAAHGLKRFTERIFDYSRLDRPSPASSRQHVSLSELFVDTFTTASEKPNWQIDIEDTEIYCHMDILHRIIRELTSNIVQYAPDAHITVSASVEDATMFLRFSDDGPGIDEDRLKNCLQPLEEITDYLTAGEHFPLGLRYITKAVKNMAGNLEIKTEPGSGTDILVSIPNVIPEAQSKAA